MSVAPLVRVHGLHKAFGAHQVLRGIDLAVMAGETVVILGPSGSGKSTLLRCINHLEPIDRGVVLVGDMQIGYALRGGHLRKLPPRAIARQRRRIGMVFQQFNLYPHMTVLENITEAPVGVHGETRQAARAYALELLHRVGLSDKGRRLSAATVRRAAAAGGDRPRPGDQAAADAVR